MFLILSMILFAAVFLTSSERVPEYIDGVRQVFDFNFEFEHRGCRVNFKVKTDYSDNEEMISQWIAF